MSLENYKAVRNTFDVVILATEDRVKDKSLKEHKTAGKGLQILLVKRDSEPFKDTWTLPGAFIDYERTISDCVDEKLFQKTGLTNIYKEQLYTYGDNLQRDPRDRVITIGYLAIVNRDLIKADKHDKETSWFWVYTDRTTSGVVVDIRLVDENNPDNQIELGFDHKDIIIGAINRLCNKVMYTDIGFHFVKEEFIISELEKSYEALLNKPVPSFRRIIAPKIVETGKLTSDNHKRGNTDPFRPSKIYRKRNETDV